MSASARVDRYLRKHGASTVGPLDRRQNRLDRFRKHVLKSIENNRRQSKEVTAEDREVKDVLNELDEEENRLIDSMNEAWDVYINSDDRGRKFDLVWEATCNLDRFYQFYRMRILANVSDMHSYNEDGKYTE